MRDDLVSVIVPTYNRAGLLPRAIDSALGQTHGAVEVIVVDDGSTDGTEALLRNRYGAEPRLVRLAQSNRGVCAARNRGIKAARGAFFAFLDSDDAWKPRKLELQLACLRRRPESGMCWTDMEALAPDGSVAATRYLKTMYSAWRWFREEELFARSEPLEAIAPGLPEAAQRRLWSGDIYSAMVAGNLVHTSTVVLRRERLERVGGFDLSFGSAGEDHDFHLRTCREGPVTFVDVPSILYQTGLPDRLSARRETMARNYLRTLERALAEDRDRIQLPPWVLAEAQATAHGWVASCLLERGARREARRHLVRSLSRKPRQPRAWIELALTSSPASLDAGARAFWGLLKSRRRAAPGG